MKPIYISERLGAALKKKLDLILRNLNRDSHRNFMVLWNKKTRNITGVRELVKESGPGCSYMRGLSASQTAQLCLRRIEKDDVLGVGRFRAGLNGRFSREVDGYGLSKLGKMNLAVCTFDSYKIRVERKLPRKKREETIVVTKRGKI